MLLIRRVYELGKASLGHKKHKRHKMRILFVVNFDFDFVPFVLFVARSANQLLRPRLKSDPNPSR